MCFTTPSSNNFSIGQLNRAIISDDFNNDGKPDIVANNYSSNSISLLLGNGIGGVTTNTLIPVTYSPYDLTGADFNGDGKKDVATLNSSSSKVSLLMGNGINSFTETLIFTCGSNPRSLNSADVNGDGKTDLIVVAGTTTNNIIFYYGDGTGNFPSSSSITTGNYISGLVKSDFNGDNNLDLVVTTNAASNNVVVFLGNGIGVFTPVAGSITLNSPGLLSILDYNGDGKRDLAVIYDTNQDKVSVLGGSGTGSFSLTTSVVASDGAASVIGADINNDGKADILTAHSSSGFINVLLGDGVGNFITSDRIISGANPVGLLDKDINNDGLTDLAILLSGATSGKIALLVGVAGSVFNSPSLYTSTGSTMATEARDFDNDGNPDIAVVDYEKGISIFYGTGTGEMDVIKSHPVGTSVTAIKAADLNSDGLLDIIVTLGISNYARILINTGSRTFTLQPVPLTVTSGPISIDVGDFNNDGNLDIVTGCSGFYNVSVLYGNGLGAFPSGAYSFSVGAQPYYVIAEDFNNDGFDDIVASVSGPQKLAVLLSTGTNSFLPVVTYTTGGAPRAIATADFNNDGNKDIVVSNTVSNQLTVLFGNGSGGFTFSAGYAQSSNALGQSLVVADFNGDAMLDVAIAHNVSNTGTISILPGTGSGAFAAPMAISSTLDPYALAVTDFNKDGKPDLVVTNKSIQSVTILTNLAPTLTVSAPSSTICAGSSFTLSAGGATSYTWTNGVINGASFTPIASTVYSVTGSNGCGYGHATATVTLEQSAPTITASVSSSVTCNGTPVILSAIGANTYTWNSGVLNGVAFTPTVTSTYTVTGTNACGADSDTISIMVNELPAVSATSNNTMICAGETVTLTAVGASSYTWSTSSNSATISVSPTVTASYTVNGSDMNGCTNTAILTQDVNVCTGINQFAINETIIFPNPATEKVIIQSNSELNIVELVNVTGQTIISESVTNKTHQLNLSDVANGIYIISIYQKDKIVKREKIIVNK